AKSRASGNARWYPNPLASELTSRPETSPHQAVPPSADHHRKPVLRHRVRTLRRTPTAESTRIAPPAYTGRNSSRCTSATSAASTAHPCSHESTERNDRSTVAEFVRATSPATVPPPTR